MRELHPTVPKNLNLYARELLEALAGHPEAAEIVLGGGVALSHYVEYRGTVDMDAWWRGEVNTATRALARGAMDEIATKHGLQFRLRTWGETESYELLRDGQKVFSFQISIRTQYMDTPHPADWTPVMILCDGGTMSLDHSVYPDVENPPNELASLNDKADYMERVCSAFDFGIFPEREDWRRFAGWREVFDRFPLPHSPAYHTFRARYGWPDIPRGTHGLIPGWKIADLREGREDLCENTV